jgi:hypothetical protein
MSHRYGLSSELSELLAAWREANWPPQGMRPLAHGEPVYQGTHAQLTKLSHSLREVMLKLESHIQDECGGRVPRWMSIPKLIFHVERINLVQTKAKASRRFADLTRLQAACGNFPPAKRAALAEWFDAHPGDELVAHRPFNDLRALIHVRGEPARRVRFHESGLVLAPPPDQDMVLVQDHRKVERQRRRDALADPLAVSSLGYTVFVAPKPRKPQS